MKDAIPQGWVHVGGSVSCRGTHAVQLVHESVMDFWRRSSDATVMSTITIADQPGWVRGVGARKAQAMRDAIRRAKLHPPTGLH